jgi:DHA2 family methylenomycin A resistance protein-like MFS transporter
MLNTVEVKALFIIPLILALAGFWMVTKYIPESRTSSEINRNDGIALAVWTFGACALVFSGILQGSLGWTHPMVLTGAVFGGVVLIGLNWLSSISDSQPWKFSLYYQRQLGIVILAGVVLNIALFAVLVQTFNFLYKVQEISALTAGIGLAPIVLGALLFGSLLFGSLANRLNARFGLRDTLAIGLLVVAIPAIGLYVLDPGLSSWVIIPFLILLGFGFILGNAPRLVLLSTSVPINLSATIQSIGSATA